jgi:hypothetical protein
MREMLGSEEHRRGLQSVTFQQISTLHSWTKLQVHDQLELYIQPSQALQWNGFPTKCSSKSH